MRTWTLTGLALLAACGGNKPVSDAGVDAGLDAGPVDAGDAGPADAGPGDSGFVDHGAPSTTYPAYPIDWPQLIGTDAGVLTAPRFVAVTFDGDPLRAPLEQFVSAIGGSPYWATTTAEYGVGVPTVLAPVHLAGPAGAVLDDADIQTWLLAQLDGTHPEWPAPNGQTLYVLAYPTGTRVTFNNGAAQSCQQFGGYHNSVLLQGTVVPYAVLPRCPGSTSVAALSTELQVLTGVTSHELIEAVTDFDPGTNSNGYRFPQAQHLPFVTFAGAETGDMCEFSPAAWITDPTLNATVQRTWSNVAAAAGHEPCIPVAAGPYFVAVPTDTEDVAMVYGPATLSTRGINLAPGESRTVEVKLVSSGDTMGPFQLTAVDRQAFFGQGRALTFSFDRTSGVNGEKVYLTITRTGSDMAYGGAMPYAVVATQGTTKNYWFAIVGAR